MKTPNNRSRLRKMDAAVREEMAAAPNWSIGRSNIMLAGRLYLSELIDLADRYELNRPQLDTVLAQLRLINHVAKQLRVAA